MPNTTKLLDGTLAELFDIEAAEVSLVPAGANGLPLLAVKGLANEFEMPDTADEPEESAGAAQLEDEPEVIAEKSSDLLSQLARKMLAAPDQEHVEIAKLMDAAANRIAAQSLQIRELRRKLDQAQQRVPVSAHVPESHGEQPVIKKESPFPAYWQGGKSHGLVGQES